VRSTNPIPFPEPTVTIAGRNFWGKGVVRGWTAAIAGRSKPEPQADDETLLNSRQVRAMFGGVSEMWLHRRRYPERAA
jgi:hypothetical protein